MRRTLALALLALGLPGCGFHPRGAVVLPDSLATIHVRSDNPSGPLAARTVRMLERTGARVTAHENGAGAVLELGPLETRRSVLSVDPSGRVSEYQTSLGFTYALRSAAGDDLIPPTTLTLNRDYVFELTAVLAKGNEDRQLQDEMLDEAVRRIAQRLRAVARNASSAAVEPPAPPAVEPESTEPAPMPPVLPSPP